MSYFCLKIAMLSDLISTDHFQNVFVFFFFACFAYPFGRRTNLSPALLTMWYFAFGNEAVPWTCMCCMIASSCDARNGLAMTQSAPAL